MTVPDGEGFPKAARIRRRREFLALGRMGERRHTEHFVLLSRVCDGPTRLGITVSRKVGGAVVRNRVKRRVREIFRRAPDRLLPERDLIVIAKPGAGTLTCRETLDELHTGARAPRSRRPRVRS
jgi:ribonuclease P protein component